MKININLCLVSILLILAGPMAVAQSADNISIPSTPSFSILGFEPASIMRPADPKQLSADILNSIDKDGTLLLNLGIEIAPYWLVSRPNLTRKMYDEAKGWQLFAQSLKLSAATVKDSATGNNKLGTGVRFRLLGGRPTDEFREKQRQLQDTMTLITAVSSARRLARNFANRDSLISFLDETLKTAGTPRSSRTLVKNIAERLKPNYENSVGDLERFAEDINTELANAVLGLREEVSELSKRRVGTIIEFAAATSFITNTTDQFEKAGVWLNASRVISTTDAFSFSVRYFFSGKDSVTTNADFGLGYIKETGNFSLSVEALGRAYRAEIPDFNQDDEPITRLEKDFTYRLAIQAAYRISEDISINLSLGKDFDAPFLERSGFFSVFGVNYSIFHNKAAP